MSSESAGTTAVNSKCTKPLASDSAVSISALELVMSISEILALSPGVIYTSAETNTLRFSDTSIVSDFANPTVVEPSLVMLSARLPCSTRPDVVLLASVGVPPVPDAVQLPVPEASMSPSVMSVRPR